MSMYMYIHTHTSSNMYVQHGIDIHVDIGAMYLHTCQNSVCVAWSSHYHEGSLITGIKNNYFVAHPT